VIIHWNDIHSTGTETNDTVVTIILSAHDQVLLSHSDNLQTAITILHNTTKQFGMEISP